MSLRRKRIFSIGPATLAMASLLAAIPAGAQYPGQLTKTTKDAPELRAIAVLEWTGDAGKPKASRIVPVAVLDDGQLQDGGIYLARPEPLALAGEVEYQLEQNGKTVGLYDIRNAGQEQGSWVGYGSWKAMPRPKPKPSMSEVARMRIGDEDSDVPILHRKHHPDDTPTGSTSTGSKSGQAPPSDPDRPTLHKKDTSEDTGDTGTTKTASSPAPDPDRPKLKKQTADEAYVDSVPNDTDPDRPRLKRGKSNTDALNVVPSLMGLPPDMHQTVAVSDAKNRPDHPWSYTWANPADEAKMKLAMEDIARNALGLNSPTEPPPATKPTPKRSATRKKAKPVTPPALPPPEPLVDEQFRVFELAYGSGATLVLSAHSAGPLAQEKLITLIAQPDLYGNVLVLLKSVTDGAHLDETPRMRLVDAVDAMADNRGELLFELRGATQRQFALYRVLRGQAEKLFVTGGGEYGAESSN
jgi:hypothetical protein